MTCGGTDKSWVARFMLASAFAIGGVSSLAMAGVQGQSRPLAEWLQFGPGVINHPIGIQYPYGRSPNRGTVFRLASLLPPQVRLPDDTVSCVSCHNLYARSRNLLSVPIDDSTLCFTCHDI